MLELGSKIGNNPNPNIYYYYRLPNLIFIIKKNRAFAKVYKKTYRVCIQGALFHIKTVVSFLFCIKRIYSVIYDIIFI